MSSESPEHNEHDEQAEHDELTRAEQILARIKADQRRRGKFGLLSLFLFVLVVAAVLALVRATIGFPWFLEQLFTASMLLFGCAPLGCWTIVNLLYARGSARQRTCASLLLGLLIVLCFSVAIFWQYGANVQNLLGLVVAAAIFWPLQFVCIGVVYWTLFRESSVVRRRQSRESEAAH